MTPDGIPDLNEVTKAVEAGSALSKSLASIFPGVTIRSRAKAENKATDRMLEDLKKIKDSQDRLGLSDESILEIMGNAVQRHSRNVNFSAVLEFAEPKIKSDSNPSSINRDWAENFRDHAEKACDDDVRRTWAAILAGEINEPGSFSKRTLSILSDMGKREAESFMKLCSYSTGLALETTHGECILADLTPVLVKDPNGSSYNGGKITLTELSTLESFGLIDKSMFFTRDIMKGAAFPFLAKDVLVIAESVDARKKINFMEASFRPAGLELSRICGIGCAPDLADILSAMFKKNGLKVVTVPFNTKSIKRL